MADGDAAFVADVVDVVVLASDGDGLGGVPVGGGEGQVGGGSPGPSVCRAVYLGTGCAGGPDGDVISWFGGELDGVGIGIGAVFSYGDGALREGYPGGVVVGYGGGHAVDAEVGRVAVGTRIGNCVADGDAAVGGVVDVVVLASDGDGLGGVPVGGGEGQVGGGSPGPSVCRAVYLGTGCAGGPDGDVIAGFGVEFDGVGIGGGGSVLAYSDCAL